MSSLKRAEIPELNRALSTIEHLVLYEVIGGVTEGDFAVNFLRREQRQALEKVMVDKSS